MDEANLHPDALRKLEEGDPQLATELLPRLYEELREIAGKLMGADREGHTLQPTALVHEAWMKLAGSPEPPRCADQRHFLRLAARAMRMVLVDHARAKGTLKRGKGVEVELLDDWLGVVEERVVDVVVLNEALDRLTAIDEELARLVELRFFAGFSIPETAALLEVSPSTVERAWRTARAWLRRELGGAAGP